VLLGAGASEVLLVSALDGLALGELLAGALVGLADGEAVAGKSLALLGEVGKVLLVGLGVVLLLGLGGGGDLRLGVASGVLNLGGGNVGASLLVRPLGLALYLAPAVTSLLLVLAVELSVDLSHNIIDIFELTRCQCGCDGRRGRS
jgi:hypothetical protein